MARLILLGIAAIAAHGAQVWTARMEEPTGLYAREQEVVSVPLARVGNNRQGFTVTDEQGREQPWQVTEKELLFPASLIPGEQPGYRIACCAGAKGKFANPILLRRIGQTRVEFGNRFFRVVVDLPSGAIVEAYSLRAGPQRMVNLVETTPEGDGALKGDVHEKTVEARTFSPKPVTGVDGPNVGWTSEGAGGFTGVEFVETGPLRARVKLTRAGSTWEIWWTATGAWFRWSAKGFRFTAVSATPYVPFNRCVDGDEHNYPAGPEAEEPSGHEVAARKWSEMPGGHIVYYQQEENYGALGIAALDAKLRWKGACSRRFTGTGDGGNSEIAVTFPEWKGSSTVLEARREYRTLRQPLLVSVSGPVEQTVAVTRVAARAEEAVVVNRAASLFQEMSVPLDGEWELAFGEKGQEAPRTGWRKVRVPGTVHTQWLARDQWYTREAEWLSGKEWWYRRTFQVPASYKGRRLRLQFEATDYYADVWVNGEHLGRHEGYIDPYEYDASAVIKPGSENTVLVRVWTPVSYYWKHRPYTIKGAYGAVDQKPDDITPLGITRPVRLVASRGGVIRDVGVQTVLKGAEAEVQLEVAGEGTTAGYQWEATLSARNFQSAERYQVKVAASKGEIRIPVKNPRLWWTRDHGAPNLYTLELRLLDEDGRAVDGRSEAVGIREIEKRGWNFVLNGKQMFIRGTNYYDNLFLSEMNRVRYEQDMELMLGMNVNMIRLHCHFSNREFYELADEKGVLLWQDYLEAWYPHDRRFSLRAAALYDAHIKYVRNHPSVALWATSDEEDFENYRDLTKHLAARASLMDPQRRAVVRSTGRFGDSHVYHGWYDGSIWEYTQMEERFVSELGATSLPNYETLQKFMGGKWPIREHMDEWIWRRLQIEEAFRAWGDPGAQSMEEYIPKTQAYVARLFQVAIERMRRRKADGAGGILHFHAIDIWPSVTMAAIDFERVPTKVYDTVRRSFEPVGALFEYERDRWKPGETVRCGLWAVNDSWDAVVGSVLRWRVEGEGGELQAGSMAVELEADSVKETGAVEFRAGKAGQYRLRAELMDGKGKRISENIFEFEVRP